MMTNGVARTTANATVFPNGVGLGATFDTDLIKQVGFVIGNEARGLTMVFFFLIQAEGLWGVTVVG